MPLYIFWLIVAEMGPCRPPDQIARHFVVFRPFSFGWTSFLMSRCTRALNGQINSCGRGAWEMRGAWYLRRTPRRSILQRSHPLSGNPDAVGVDKRRWGVVQPVGHLTVNEDGGGSNPPAPANFLTANGAAWPRANPLPLASLHLPILSIRHPSIRHCCSPSSAGFPPPARIGIRLRSTGPASYSYRVSVARCRVR